MLLLKIIFVPSLLGLASIAARRWGPAVGGWVVALPLTSGPLLGFLALEQGSSFAVQAARGTLLGLVPLCGFYIGYGWAARRFSWAPCVTAGLAVCLSLTALLNQVSTSTIVSFAAGLSAIAVTYWVLPRAEPAKPAGKRSSWEIPFRMAVALVVVLGITGAANKLGPHLAGLLTSFPTTSGVLAPFTHREQGAGGAVRVLRGVTIGLVSFAVFFGTVAALIGNTALGTAFVAAAVLALAVHGIILLTAGTYKRDEASA
jgi:hypothetical protein